MKQRGTSYNKLEEARWNVPGTISGLKPLIGNFPKTFHHRYLKGSQIRRRSGVFIVNFEHFSHLALVFLLLTLNM